MSCNKSNCIISLGLTIMDRCPECEEQERAVEEAERVERNRAFAARWTRSDSEEYVLVPPFVKRYAELAAKQMADNTASLRCCDKPHESGASFFVGCREDDGKRRKSILLGPYSTHEEAIANVDRGRKLAEANDPKAHWYSFGTCSISEPTETKGVFGV